MPDYVQVWRAKVARRGTWLDVLRWSVPDGEERLMARRGVRNC